MKEDFVETKQVSCGAANSKSNFSTISNPNKKKKLYKWTKHANESCFN